MLDPSVNQSHMMPVTSNSDKRPFLQADEERVAKKARCSYHMENGSPDEAVFDRSSGQPLISSTSCIDLTQDEPMEGILPTDTQLNLPSIRSDLVDEHDETLPKGVTLTATSGAITSDAAIRGSERSGAAALSATTPAAARSGDAAPVAAYDVCFGLLCIKSTALSENKVPAECTPVTLNFEANVLKAYLVGEDKCVAVVLSPALLRLVSEFAVTLTATICGKKPKSIGVREAYEAGSRAVFSAKFCTLRIIVYGFLQQKDAVAHVLAQEGLFLQHPGEAEFDEGAKYFNPQYLLAPGQDMPPLEKLSISTCCVSGAASSSNKLRDYEKNEILKIFDTAYKSGEAMATVEPSPRLITKLKRHQIEALTMMVEKEAGIYDGAQFPAIWKPFSSPSGQVRYQNLVTRKFITSSPRPMGGGILADEMGLGKTLSSLSLICYSLDCKDSNPDLSKDLPRATLIITPKTTIPGWEKQIENHIQPQKVRCMTYHGPKRHQDAKDIRFSDVVLTTYDCLRSDRTKNGPLFEQEWERIILDEAHKIRNRYTNTFQAVRAVRANFHWCLTGTPIHNQLDDFGALLTFIDVEPFQSRDFFEYSISKPVKERKKGSLEMLRKVVAATCLRRTKADHALTLNLPKKLERVEHVEMPREDRKLYEFFKRFSFLNAAEGKTSKNIGGTNILTLIIMLRLICDHGEALLPESALKAWRDRDPSLLTLKMLESGVRRCISCDREIEELDTTESVIEELTCGHVFCESCATKFQRSESQPPCLRCDAAGLRPPSVLSPAPSQSEVTFSLKPKYPPSAKLQALLRNITEGQSRPTGETMPPKHVVFSYWTKMLDLIGTALREKGREFCRIDGKSSMAQRKNALESFGSNPECNIMLASIGAAGEGIDLTAANWVHIVEPQWNPMAEAQAIDRAHRIGQQRDVEVIRYIVSESIETYVQWVQMDKQRLIKETLSPSGRNTEKATEGRWKKLLTYLQLSNNSCP